MRNYRGNHFLYTSHNRRFWIVWQKLSWMILGSFDSFYPIVWQINSTVWLVWRIVFDHFDTITYSSWLLSDSSLLYTQTPLQGIALHDSYTSLLLHLRNRLYTSRHIHIDTSSLWVYTSKYETDTYTSNDSTMLSLQSIAPCSCSSFRSTIVWTDS